MALLGIDLGGTKIAFAVFSAEGSMLSEKTILLNGLKGPAIGHLITEQVSLYQAMAETPELTIDSIGVSVPGIYNKQDGTVWAPNIEAWNNYPLLNELQAANPQIPAIIDNDRVCYILGECWQGNTRSCQDAIYISVGTGIGAGIMTNGTILRGTDGIAGAIGWMALSTPFHNDFKTCGYFETYASGNGLAKYVQQLIISNGTYNGVLKARTFAITSYDVFKAHEDNDVLATEAINHCIELWGLAIANLVSIFNPEKIIMGGGLFGPALKFLPAIQDVAARWAQPVSSTKYSLEGSALGSHAGVYGAAFLALQNLASPAKNGHE